MMLTVISWLIAVFIQQLGSPNFYERERASLALSRLLPESETALRRTLKSEDPELVVRADAILKRWWQDSAPAKAGSILPTNYKLLPWIDRLPVLWPDRDLLIDHYLSLAQQKVGRGGPPIWEDYRLATEMWLTSEFSEGKSKCELMPVLDSMRDSEIEWINENGKRYTPPLVVPWVKSHP